MSISKVISYPEMYALKQLLLGDEFDATGFSYIPPAYTDLVERKYAWTGGGRIFRLTPEGKVEAQKLFPEVALSVDKNPVIVEDTDFIEDGDTATQYEWGLPTKAVKVVKAIGIDAAGNLWKYCFKVTTNYVPGTDKVQSIMSSPAYNFEPIDKLPEPGEDW